MFWIDWVVIAVLAFYIIDGYRRGFFELIIELITFVISVTVAFLVGGYVGQFIGGRIGLPVSSERALGFLLTWFLGQTLLSLLIRLIFKIIPREWRMAKWNKWAGIAPSLGKGIIILSIILLILTALPISTNVKGEAENSLIAGKITKGSLVMEGLFQKAFGYSVKDSISFLTINPDKGRVAGNAKTEKIILKPDERLELNFTTTNVKVSPKDEAKMLELVNSERQGAGLKPLAVDEKLVEVARLHGRDMFAKGYFSHINLEGESPFDRMAALGINFQEAGENLALAPTVEQAHDGLMKSPGHRANIMDAKFGHIGIGVIDGGVYGKIFVQEFKD